MSTSDELHKFFNFLWNDTTGLVYLPTRDPNNMWRSLFFHWPQDANKIVQQAQLNSAEGREVFVSPVLYNADAFQNAKEAKETGNDWDAKRDVLGTHVLWADLDGTAPAEWPAEPSDTLPTPSLRVRSSTPDRQHAYWKLDHFEQDVEAIETKNRSLAYLLDADKSGWDASQLLRPPGTVNHGYGKPERKGQTYEVFTEDTTGHTYQLDFFDPRPILGGKSGGTLPSRQFHRLIRFSPRESFRIYSTIGFSGPKRNCQQTEVRRIAKLHTSVQRRDLMTRQFTLSWLTSMIDGGNTPTEGIASLDWLRLLNEPDENTLMV